MNAKANKAEGGSQARAAPVLSRAEGESFLGVSACACDTCNKARQAKAPERPCWDQVTVAREGNNKVDIVLSLAPTLECTSGGLIRE